VDFRSQETGTRCGFHSREHIVTCLRMKEKIYQNTPACSKTCRNEFSSGFPGSWERNSVRVSFPRTREPIATGLNMKEKICLNTLACSKTRRNDCQMGYRKRKAKEWGTVTPLPAAPYPGAYLVPQCSTSRNRMYSLE